MVVQVSDLSTRQLANGLIVFAAALPFGEDAVKAALMTAMAESSLLRYANNGESTRPEVWKAYGGRENFRKAIRESMLYPHDSVAGAAWTTADSIGLFQQRPSYDYGSIKDLMDPAESTRIFVRGSVGGDTRFFLESPSTMSLAQRCQWTQGSEFPTGENYAPMETVADQLIAHFGGLPETKDWFNQMANNWTEAKAELDASLAQLKNQIASLYNDNHINNADGSDANLPYGKIATMFNAVQSVEQALNPRTSQVDGLSYSLGDFLVSIDRKLSELQAKVDALAAKQ